jgi:hypothetical protein
MIRKIAVSLAVAAIGLAPFASRAADADKPMEVRQTTKKGMAAGGRVEQVSATIVAVDAAARTVTLENKKGEKETIKIGPEVKNFDQIKAGDKVTLTVSVGVVLSMANPDAKAPEPTVTVQGDSAAPGQKPAGDVKATVKGQVTVAAIDMKTRVVTLQGQEGRKYKVTAGPNIPLEKLKIGDKVNAEYTEAVAIAVTPAGAKKPAKKATK